MVISQFGWYLFSVGITFGSFGIGDKGKGFK